MHWTLRRSLRYLPGVLAWLKASLHRCISSVLAISSCASASASATGGLLGNTWVEPFPARLGADRVASVKAKLEDSYP